MMLKGVSPITAIPKIEIEDLCRGWAERWGGTFSWKLRASMIKDPPELGPDGIKCARGHTGPIARLEIVFVDPSCPEELGDGSIDMNDPRTLTDEGPLRPGVIRIDTRYLPDGVTTIEVGPHLGRDRIVSVPPEPDRNGLPAVDA